MCALRASALGVRLRIPVNRHWDIFPRSIFTMTIMPAPGAWTGLCEKTVHTFKRDLLARHRRLHLVVDIRRDGHGAVAELPAGLLVDELGEIGALEVEVAADASL